MAYTESGKQASYKYRKQNIRRLSLDYRLPEFEEVKAAAAAAGMPAAAYVKAAVAAYGKQGGASDAGHDAGQPDAETVERVLALQSWYKPDAALYIPVGTKTVAALEKIAKDGESAIQCAARLLGDAIKAAPQGERGAPEQGGLTPQLQKK